MKGHSLYAITLIVCCRFGSRLIYAPKKNLKVNDKRN